MTDLLILCPTRGRPAAAREAHQSFVATKSREGTEILFVVDDDDPELPGYMAEDFPFTHQPPPGNMVTALNIAARWAVATLKPKYVGFIGDDHRFRTAGWDSAFVELLEARGGGFVYGNDLFWPNGEIPTQIVMSASIIEALGWMGLPGCTHLYIDNAWRQIGEETKSLFYMPDIVIEHMHPAGGKAVWDEGHLRVNTEEMYSHDRAAFEAWLASSADEDIARVRSALGRPTP